MCRPSRRPVSIRSLRQTFGSISAIAATIRKPSIAATAEALLSTIVMIIWKPGFNPSRPNSDLSQTSHCNIKGLSVSEVKRIENMITQVKFYWYFNSFSPTTSVWNVWKNKRRICNLILHFNKVAPGAVIIRMLLIITHFKWSSGWRCCFAVTVGGEQIHQIGFFLHVHFFGQTFRLLESIRAVFRF